MFQLKWLSSGFKNAFVWLTGAGVILFIWKALNTYLLKRSVKQSLKQADKDSTELQKDVSSAESDWVNQGKLNDEDKNSS